MRERNVRHYLYKQANQDIKRKFSTSFVVKEEQTELIRGYYNLSNNSIPLEDIPESIRKRMPRSYTTISTTLLGRLAIDTNFQGQVLGKLILIDALKEVLNDQKPRFICFCC